MDAFATYDQDASQLEDPQRFWEEVEDLLNGQSGTSTTQVASTSNASDEQQTLLARLTSFYALCDACFDTHLDHAYNSDYLLTRLVDSPLLHDAASLQECCNVLVSLATTSKSLPSLFLVYDTMLKFAARHPNVFSIEQSSRLLIPRLVHHFWAARFAEGVMEREGKIKGQRQHDVATNGHVDEQSAEATAENTIPDDWHMQHIRSTSAGHAKREQIEVRDRRLHCKMRDKAVRLLYEICRAQKLTAVDLRAIDATFVNHLFELVEHSRNWDDDTYNYQLIKLIVALNEQFMVSGIATSSGKQAGSKKSAVHSGNTVMTVLRTRLNASKTFGENLIFMLNRASSLNAEDVCMQLLLLKLLYLLFTTKETSHYFYTNDLKVLVDIFIRELSDLSDEHESLRHTYLRVLHPLLTNTQLLTYPYKRPQIRKLLVGLVAHAQVREISSTTQRLVDRCLQAQWCVDLDQGEGSGPTVGIPQMHHFSMQSIGGGSKITFEAPVLTNAEGIAIPVQENMQPLQGALKSEATTAAIAATQEEPDLNDKSDVSSLHVTSSPTIASSRLPGRTPSQKSLQGRRRRSLSGGTPPSPTRDLRDQAIRAQAVGHHLESAAINGTNASRQQAPYSTLPRHILSGRNRLLDRATSNSSMQLRTHSSLDVSRMDSGDETDDDGNKWEVGSGSQSWHQTMVGQEEQRASSSNAEQIQSPTQMSSTSSDGGAADRQASLLLDPTASSSSFDDSKTFASSRSSGSGASHGAALATFGKSSGRRAPPAPPVADIRSRTRAERNGGVLTSGSDPILVLPSADGCDSISARILTPAARVDSGTESSREASPMMLAQRIVRARSNSGATGTSSPTTGQRRRPPPPPTVSAAPLQACTTQEQPQRKIPPPVDRSTKGSRLQVPGIDSRRGSSSSMRSSDMVKSHAGLQRTPTEDGVAAPDVDAEERRADLEQSQHNFDEERRRQEQYMARYMDQLHVSSASPYGWT